MMNFSDHPVQPDGITECTTATVHKWEIYERLQMLEIPCQCDAHRPLTVYVSNAYQGLQYWSIVRRLSSSRSELLKYIESCWQLSPYREHNLDN